MTTKKITIYAIGLIALAFTCSCSDDSDSNGNPTVTFSKALGGPSEEVVSSNVSVDISNDGKYIVSSDTREQGVFDTDMYAVLLDSEGNVEWEKSYNAPNFSSSAESVIADPNGGYLLAGGYNGGMASLTKIDENGVEQWSQTLGGGEADKVVLAPDGGYMVYHSGQFPEFTKILSVGAIDFNVQFDPNSGFFAGSDFIVTSDDNYMLLGNSTSAHTAILKMDAQGNQLWSKNINNDDMVASNGSISENASGGYTICTWKYLDDNFFESDIYIINVNSQGDVINEFALNLGSNAIHTVGEITQATDGFYVVGSKGVISGGTITDRNVLVLKLNNNGQKVWEKTYGTVGSDGGDEIMETADGGFIAVGNAESDIYVIKANSNGDVN